VQVHLLVGLVPGLRLPPTKRLPNEHSCGTAHFLFRELDGTFAAKNEIHVLGDLFNVITVVLQ
jgi:hypothetical protein